MVINLLMVNVFRLDHSKLKFKLVKIIVHYVKMIFV